MDLLFETNPAWTGENESSTLFPKQQHCAQATASESRECECAHAHRTAATIEEKGDGWQLLKKERKKGGME